MMYRLYYIAVVTFALAASSSALQCVSCKNSKCTPPPPECEIGQRPCSCCMECRVNLGGECGPFSPECNTALVCLTNGGAFNGRPPYWMNLVGKCVKPESLSSTPQPSQLIPTAPRG